MTAARDSGSDQRQGGPVLTRCDDCVVHSTSRAFILKSALNIVIVVCASKPRVRAHDVLIRRSERTKFGANPPNLTYNLAKAV
jgi:hypothetical protein